MQRPLDPLSFKKNTYDRPNQDWVCGRAAEGHACPLGPSAKGGCRHTGECIPAKKEHRWICTRGEAHGGKCDSGPLPDGTCAHPIPPCQPVRSLRKARGLYVGITAAVTAGALLILFSTPYRHTWEDPGPLTNAHATSATTCSDCHAVLPARPAQLASAIFSSPKKHDSQLCLKCHQMGDLPLHPHGIAEERLAQSRARQAAASPNEKKTAPLFLQASHALARAGAQSHDLACATCHQEHHGRTFDLKQLSDAQCQSCHATQFASFAEGHPEFTRYPYQRRTRIFFDHSSHLRQHFAEKKELAPPGCQSCHVPGPNGSFMQVKSFNASCASCHAPQIKGEGMTVKGVAFFAIPGLDAETLANHHMSIGEWPRFADSKLTPFMEVLLKREPNARAAMEKLQGVDLLDLTKATPEQLAAAGELAWAVKSLLSHIVHEGQPFLLKQLEGEIAPAGLEVPRAALLAAQKEWLPNLDQEMAGYAKGIKPPLPDRPAASPTAAPAAAATKSAGDDDLSAFLEATPTPAPAAEKKAEDDDLSAFLEATPTPAPAAAKKSDAGDDDLSAFLEATPTPSSSPSAIAPPLPAAEAMPAEEWVAAGGWYRPQDSFTLFYRPIGHADPFLIAWLDAAARFQKDKAEASSTFAKLADPQNPGLCFKCHTAEVKDTLTTVNWKPAQPDVDTRPFTTFNHTTHFSLVGDAGCQTCHALDAQSTYPKFFAREHGADQAEGAFQSNFAPISKMLCAECHQPRVAGDGCILCHRYHAAPKAGKLAEIGQFHTASGEKKTPPGLATK